MCDNQKYASGIKRPASGLCCAEEEKANNNNIDVDCYLERDIMYE